MAVKLSKSQDEIGNMPLVELACEILKQTKEPVYFRDLMKEIQDLRGMSEEETMKVIARLYTELNIDGRFLCLGQNVWGLKRWYPVDKTQEKSLTSKRFVRKSSGDAFSDDDEDFTDDDESEDVDDEDIDEPGLTHDDSNDDDFIDEDADEDEDSTDDSDEDFLDEDSDDAYGNDDEEIEEGSLEEELETEDEDEEDY